MTRSRRKTILRNDQPFGGAFKVDENRRCKLTSGVLTLRAEPNQPSFALAAMSPTRLINVPDSTRIECRKVVQTEGKEREFNN